MPANTYLNYYLAITYYYLGEYEACINSFINYINENPDDWESHYYISLAYGKTGHENYRKSLTAALDMIKISKKTKAMKKAERELIRLLK